MVTFNSRRKAPFVSVSGDVVGISETLHLLFPKPLMLKKKEKETHRSHEFQESRIAFIILQVLQMSWVTLTQLTITEKKLKYLNKMSKIEMIVKNNKNKVDMNFKKHIMWLVL